MLVIFGLNNEKRCFIEKTLAFLFFLYRAWYEPVIGYNSILLYGIAGLLTVMVMIRLYKGKRITLQSMPGILIMYFVFLVYSLSGYLVAINRSSMTSALITFLSNIVVCFDCWYISFQTEDFSWIYRILKCIALVCAFQTLLFGKVYVGTSGITMSAENNPNTLGLILLFGIFGFLIDLDPASIKSFCLTLPFNLVLLYGIMLTASRKCFLSAIAAVFFWILYSFMMMFQKNKVKDFFIALFLVILAVGIGYFYFSTQFQTSSVFTRLTQLFSEGGTNIRTALYAEAYEFFKRSPVIGIGFAQFAVNSALGYYSHTSYGEILACGGIIGTLIFFLPLLMVLIRCIKKAFAKDHLDRSYRNRMVLLIFMCELFLGVGQIFIYDMFHLLMLMLISMEIEFGLDYKKTPIKIKLVHSTKGQRGIIRRKTMVGSAKGVK